MSNMPCRACHRRKSKTGDRFMGCTQYPDCSYTAQLGVR
ncbi:MULTISPECIES: topoisomerase DNA-binding C4 zinc finger domain-containing protein [Rhizobium]|nr:MULTISPECIES: topoisomerase DNA-binding C4 zinc finger domain-containing protein [Rhizobium]